MNHRWTTVALSCLMILALVAALSLGCGKGKEEAKKTIIIGNLTDLSGPASTALVPLNMGLADLIKEFNAGVNPGPKLPEGVQLKVESYDDAMNPARFLPGYDWLKSKGAQVIFSILNDSSDVLKEPAARDKIAVCGFASDFYQISPPGWVFDFDAPAQWSTNLLLQWVSDAWDYETKGKPTIATVGWDDAWGKACADGVKAYVQAYPGKFTLTGTYLEPVMTTSWLGVVKKTLDVDFVELGTDGGIAPATFWKQYKDAGGTGMNIDSESMSAYAGYITDYCGWAALDGKLNSQGWALWTLAGTGTAGTGQYPVVMDDVKYTLDVLKKYHSSTEVQNQIKAGMGYMGGTSMQLCALQIVVAAINAVGADNFSGQAFYDTAINYSTTWAGDPRGFSPTNRVFCTRQVVDKWDAATQSLIMVSPGWVEVPQIPPAT